MKSLKNILIIDDDPDILSITKYALESIPGVTIRCSSSGKEALSLLQTFQPDFILLDLLMPEMSGEETLKAILLKYKIPTAFFTASMGNKEYYLQLGAIGFIQKPFDPLTFANQIRELWQSTQ